MPTVALYNMEGAAIDEIELKDEVFGVMVNKHVLILCCKNAAGQ